MALLCGLAGVPAMNAVLSPSEKPRLLRAGLQPAIAAGDDEFAAAAELELISILRSPAFRGSPRSLAFLRFVVEEALAGRRDLLKERTVGAAVLGKTPGYDTGADCGVRVRANDVRKRLAAHYDAESPKAGIRIELPRGSYAPKFVAVAAQSAPSLAAPPMRLWQLAAPSLFAAFLALVATAAAWNKAMRSRGSGIARSPGAPPSRSLWMPTAPRRFRPRWPTRPCRWSPWPALSSCRFTSWRRAGRPRTRASSPSACRRGRGLPSRCCST